MSPTVKASAQSGLVETHDFPRPRPAKADLRQSDATTVSDRIGLTFGDVVKTAVVKHFGSVKAAAISLGNVDPSLMMREFDAGKLARLEEDVTAKACVARALHEEFAGDDPKQRVRRILRDARAKLDELEDAVGA